MVLTLAYYLYDSRKNWGKFMEKEQREMWTWPLVLRWVYIERWNTTCVQGKNIWTLSAVSLPKFLRFQCPGWSYPIWLSYLASTFWLSFGIRTCYVHEWRNEVKTVETRKIIVTKHRETSQVLTPKLTRHFLYVLQDSESSEEEEGISEEEFKRTEGWKLFKEALDAHTKCNNSAKK